MRYLMFPLLTAFGLSACMTPVPDSGAGAGFDDYETYANRQQAKRDAMRPAPQNVQLSESKPLEAKPEPAPVSTAAPVVAEKPSGLSDEQNFDAVAGRETIESDKARLERIAAGYQEVTPEALPTRGDQSGVSIVSYALSTTNNVGEPIYKRFTFGNTGRFGRNCKKYPSPDLAQIAFLEGGGPQRNHKGLDPDGDGFACGWDPRPFRNAKAQ
ncbi:MAG: hypothetical protein ACPGVK_07030 [Halocynthiibacter sp.]